jgi:hypothetical protein
LVGGRKEGNWRNLEEFFKSQDDCPASLPGSIILSPGWFEQAHDVRFLIEHTI